MVRYCWIIFLSLAVLSNAYSQYGHPQSSSSYKHVIYITLDGIRWQDVYLDHTHFPKLWKKYANRLTFYGLPGSNTTMEVASIPVSLPSYQSQMSGSVQSCTDNDCGRIQATTLPEYLVNHLHFAKKDVAIFSSWPVIANAIESEAGSVYSNVGNVPVVDPFTHRPDATMAALNHEQVIDYPTYKPNRYDKYTFAQALHYFEKYQPRFLWISLVNADNEAHFANLENYHQLLSFYDDALDGLFTTLKASKLDKDTMIIVTTDHGRGHNENWTSHGRDYPESRQTWAFVMNGELLPVAQEGNSYRYSTLSIRPTIEKALS